MKTTFKKICLFGSWLYAAAILGWFALHFVFGDTLWWLALLNVFVPFFFIPIILILPAGIIWRRAAFYVCALVPLAILLLLYGNLFLPAWPSRSTPGEPTLTITSFNIWGFSHSQETIQAALTQAPDILALQEQGPEMAALLTEQLSDAYPYHAINIGIYEYGGQVFSRYPFVELDSGHLADSNWRVQILRVEANNRTFILYNVHLQASNVLAFYDGGPGFAAKVAASFGNRQDQAQRLVADIATRTEPVIVVGDFNSTDQSDVYKIVSASLTDAHRAVGWGWGNTFPAYAGSWKHLPIIPRQVRLDMVFYSTELEAQSCKVGSAHGESDHLPVTVRLAWQDR